MDNFIVNKEDILNKSLSEEHYFQSLLQMLYSNGLLSIKDMESIQFQILNILKEKLGYYTKDESSSVRVEVAEQIMLSINYTLGIFLKNKSTIKESIGLIKDKGLGYLLVQGEKILKDKFEECKRLLEVIQKTKLSVENYAYVDTIDYGIPPFFIEYDIRFASHQAPGSIDYPLANDDMNLVGIEYLENYLNRINIENMFCSNFDEVEIEALLKGFDKKSYHMLINIYKLVLTNYIGCILRGKLGRSLEINEEDRVYLKDIMENLSREQLEKLIAVAIEKICTELSINDKNHIKYINKTAFKIIPEIKNSLNTNTLKNVFITLYKSSENKLKYEDGESLNDSKFKSITEEIRECSKVDYKIKIIREELHSLQDLIDVLGADCIFDNEFIDVFNILGDFEIALLFKYVLPNSEVADNDYGTESEKEWHEKFKNYLEGLDDIRKKEVIRISQKVSI